MNKAVKNISVTIIVVILAIVLSVVGTLAFCNHQKQEAFKNGYQKAIEDAVLVESDEEGYILSFKGELHNYSFE